MTRDRILAAAVGLLAAVVHGTVTLLHFHQLRVTSWDNAIFEQVVASYARLEMPVSEAKAPGFVILGDHWSPIDALLAPVYRVFPHAQTLLLAQVALIAVSAVIITLVAIRVTGPARGALVGVLYALSFGLQSAVEADFHEVAFALPFLAMAGAAYVDRRYDQVIWWSLPLVLVKEDLGATVAMVGVVLWLAGERRRGAWVAGFGVLAVIVTTWILIPAFAGGSSYAYTGQIGADRSVVATLLDAAPEKLLTVVLTVAVTGFAALLSPWVLLVLPTFAWRFLGDNPNYWGTDWHYGMVLMPIVFIAFVDAWKRREGRLLDVPLAVGTVVTLGYLFTAGSPVGELVRPSTWDDPPRAAAAREAIASVPSGASVETDIALLKHLSTGRTAYWTGSIDLGDEDVVPDYLAFDTAGGLGSPPDPLTYAQDEYGGDWFQVYDRDGYVVVARAR